LDKYGRTDRLILEVREESVVLRAKKRQCLFWEENHCAIAAKREDWSDFDTAIADGLDWWPLSRLYAV